MSHTAKMATDYISQTRRRSHGLHSKPRVLHGKLLRVAAGSRTRVQVDPIGSQERDRANAEATRQDADIRGRG